MSQTDGVYPYDTPRRSIIDVGSAVRSPQIELNLICQELAVVEKENAAKQNAQHGRII